MKKQRDIRKDEWEQLSAQFREKVPVTHDQGMYVEWVIRQFVEVHTGRPEIWNSFVFDTLYPFVEAAAKPASALTYCLKEFYFLFVFTAPLRISDIQNNKILFREIRSLAKKVLRQREHYLTEHYFTATKDIIAATGPQLDLLQEVEKIVGEKRKGPKSTLQVPRLYKLYKTLRSVDQGPARRFAMVEINEENNRFEKETAGYATPYKIIVNGAALMGCPLHEGTLRSMLKKYEESLLMG